MLHDILLGIALAVFGSAGATAIGMIIATIAPQWHRICRLALGNVERSTSVARVRAQTKAIGL